MAMNRIMIWTTVLVMAVVAPLWARVIVVDQGGGGDVPTIQKGLNVAVDGDTVSVLPGYYDEGWGVDFLG